MNGYTPGPWTVRMSTHPETWLVTAPPSGPAEYRVVAYALPEPDARLIAAAPDLLAALQACLTAITVTPRSEMDCLAWSRLADKARNAIAACEVQS